MLHWYTKQGDCTGLLIFESVHGILGHINEPVLPAVKYLYVVSSATKMVWEGDLQIMVVDRSIMKGHTFNQAVLFAVTYDNNNNLIIAM